VQVVNMQEHKDADLQWAMDIIDRQTERMSRLIDDLMDVSRISRGKLRLRTETIDLCAALREAVETCQPFLHQKGHDLHVSLPAVPVLVNADLTRLSQVFANLLNNAGKYTDRGGRIELTAETRDDAAIVRLKDNGIGLTAEQLPGIFGMFAQVESGAAHVEGGLGIGLNLVRSLVELHGGTVTAESEGPGKGSTFAVRLPLAPKVRSTGRKDMPAVAAPANGGSRVLVVDDNNDALVTLDLLLKRHGHQVLAASDGRTALTAARDFRPDVVLLDIGLPDISGYEVARALRSEPWASELRLIAITGWGQQDDRDKAREAGFDHHLVKPVDPKALMALLARVASEPS
jgi:CheY-like chemotaxis protein